MIDFKIERSDEDIMSYTGLSVVGKLIHKTGLIPRVDDIKLPNQKNPDILNSSVTISYMGLLAQAKTNFDDIEEFRDPENYLRILGIDNVPSSPTLRQRLNAAAGIIDHIIKEENIVLLSAVEADFTPCYEDYIPLDSDVSIFDNSNTKKEGVVKTRKGIEGYSPAFSYLGKQGYMINSMLRKGSAHPHKGAEKFLKESLDFAEELIDRENILLRLDAGYDSRDILKLCLNHKNDFIIKRNLRNTDQEKIVDKAKDKGKKIELREGKTLYRGAYKEEIPELDTEIRVVFAVTEETITEDGEFRLVPEIEIEQYWTKFEYVDEKPSCEKVLELYRKRGTSEQFHSEFKTDMDLERLPSGRFDTNQLVLLLGMFVYNILRIMGQISLKRQDSPLRDGVQRRRIRTIIQNLIMIGSKLVKHARQYILKFGTESPWFKTFKRVYESFG